MGGYSKPSQINLEAHEQAVNEVVMATTKLLASLSANAAPKDRAIEAQKARARSEKRFN